MGGPQSVGDLASEIERLVEFQRPLLDLLFQQLAFDVLGCEEGFDGLLDLIDGADVDRDRSEAR